MLTFVELEERELGKYFNATVFGLYLLVLGQANDNDIESEMS